MLRFFYVIIISLPFILFYLGKAFYIEKHDDKYTETDRYVIAQRAVSLLQRNGFIHSGGTGGFYLRIPGLSRTENVDAAGHGGTRTGQSQSGFADPGGSGGLPRQP